MSQRKKRKFEDSNDHSSTSPVTLSSNSSYSHSNDNSLPLNVAQTSSTFSDSSREDSNSSSSSPPVNPSSAPISHAFQDPRDSRKSKLKIDEITSYSTSANDWENPSVFGKNKELPHSSQSIPRFSSIEHALSMDNERYFVDYAKNNLNSSFKIENILSLNGVWKFQLLEDTKNINFNFSTFHCRFNSEHELIVENQNDLWKDITVPGNWELQGFDIPRYTNITYPFGKSTPPLISTPNPVGCYLTCFEIPLDWHEQSIFLRFEGVKSAFYVWIDGQLLGYSQGSRNPAEWKINNLLNFQNPSHTLAVAVFRWCDGSYLEDQDCWDMSGIFRDVYLYCAPKSISTRDFQVDVNFDERLLNATLNVTLILRMGALETPEPLIVKTSLYDHKQTVVSSAEHIWLEQQLKHSENQKEYTVKLVLHTLCPIKWTPENPYLYTLILTVKVNKQQEIFSCPVGFRQVKVSNGNLLFNGNAIFIKGVNRHEFDEKKGLCVVSSELMKQDLLLMKQNNFNSCRCSHYPNHPLWYTLCDKFGILVVDEADIESHAEWDRFANDVNWYDQFMDRMIQMVERDKNHPSIILWSLGNESGFGEAHKLMSNWVHKRDPSRPVIYEPAHDDSCVDVVSSMYVPIADLPSKLNPDRPFLLIEYAHCMGNSCGNLKEYWRFFESNKGIQGGWIWDWVDQGILQEYRTESNEVKTQYLYGGDFGDQPNDRNFCINGLLFPNRKPHPSLFECKKVLQPISIEIASLGSDLVVVQLYNKFDFTNLKDICQGKWKLYADEFFLCEDNLTEFDLDLNPGNFHTIRISFEGTSIREMENARYYLNFEFTYKEDTLWTNQGFVLAKEQIILPWTKSSVKKEISTLFVSSPIVIEDTHLENSLELHASDFTFLFDKKRGILHQVLYKKNDPIISFGPTFNAWRAPIDNDLGGSPSNAIIWQNYGLHRLYPHNPVFNITHSDKNQVVIQIETLWQGIPPFGFQVTTIYRILNSGLFFMNMKAEPIKLDDLVSLPRVGVELQIPFDHLMWAGRGPHENYCDRNFSADWGIWKNLVKDETVPYIFPQSMGNKTDTRYISLTQKFSNSVSPSSSPILGLMVQTENFDQPFQFSALNYTTPDLSAMKHWKDLQPLKDTILSIDAEQMGVGGDNSWTPWTVLPQFRVSPKPIQLNLLFRPLVLNISKIDSNSLLPEQIIQAFGRQLFSY